MDHMVSSYMKHSTYTEGSSVVKFLITTDSSPKINVFYGINVQINGV